MVVLDVADDEAGDHGESCRHKARREPGPEEAGVEELDPAEVALCRVETPVGQGGVEETEQGRAEADQSHPRVHQELSCPRVRAYSLTAVVWQSVGSHITGVYTTASLAEISFVCTGGQPDPMKRVSFVKVSPTDGKVGTPAFNKVNAAHAATGKSSSWSRFPAFLFRIGPGSL